MGARAQFADYLDSVLPDTIEIRRTLEGVGELDNPTEAVVQLERTKLEPAPNSQGTILQTFLVWVLVPVTDMAEVEDQLDDALDLVVEAIDGCTWAMLTTATRDMHPDGYHAYKIDVTLATARQ